jgi:predicted nucleic-acid-binding protein
VRSVDTNVLARYYLRDDPAQAAVATAILDRGELFIPKTVLLELAWVLQYVAEQPPTSVVECLAHLIALPGITIEDEDAVEEALSHCRRGIDFADALHLTSSRRCDEMVTFDRRLIVRARKLALAPPVRPAVK